MVATNLEAVVSFGRLAPRGKKFITLTLRFAVNKADPILLVRSCHSIIRSHDKLNVS